MTWDWYQLGIQPCPCLSSPRRLIGTTHKN
uniref:Uncharacterized protein n=1 Tax=Rhizophora mucronata TaxID=61149 RepID=A0A2P2Q132_RHIMU